MINPNQKEEGSDWYQILAIFLASLGTFTYGLLFAWPSAAIPQIISNTSTYNITLAQASYFTVLPPIGAVLSCPFYFYLNNTIGRKLSLLSIAIPHILAWGITALTTNLHALYLGRFIVGFADACVYTVLPIYVGEIATPKVRGTWGNLMTFIAYSGEFMSNLIGNSFSVQLTAKLCLIVPIVFAAMFGCIAESPYYYLMKGREEAARSSLKKLRRREHVEEELAQLKKDVQRQMSESGTWKDLFTIKSNRRALAAGCFLRTSQQLSGCCAFIVYTQYIFAKSGGSFTAGDSALIFMGLSVTFNVLAGFVLDRMGRRKCYFLSNLACSGVLMVEGVYFFVEQFYPEVNLEAVNWVPITGMILFITFFSFGIGIVPTLMLSELFSASVKGKAMCVVNIVFNVMVGVSTKLFHVFDSEFGLFAPFLFFGGCCFVNMVLTLVLVPETKGKTLEEIQQLLKGNSKKSQDNKC